MKLNARKFLYGAALAAICTSTSVFSVFATTTTKSAQTETTKSVQNGAVKDGKGGNMRGGMLNSDALKEKIAALDATTKANIVALQEELEGLMTKERELLGFTDEAKPELPGGATAADTTSEPPAKPDGDTLSEPPTKPDNTQSERPNGGMGKTEDISNLTDAEKTLLTQYRVEIETVRTKLMTALVDAGVLTEEALTPPTSK